MGTHFHKVLGGLLIALIGFGPSVAVLGLPSQAHAQAGAVGCLSSSVGVGAGVGAAATAAQIAAVPVADKGNLLVNTQTATQQTAATTKDCLLDGIIVLLREALIAQITQSIVDWINNGFEGSPAFVTNIDQFLFDVGDRAVGEFIYGTDLGFLCSPFQLDIRLALLGQQRFRDRVNCTLTSIVDNIDGFFQGDFYSGGWPGWLSITTRTANNPYGALIEASSGLDASRADAINKQLQKLNWNSGFLSVQYCSSYDYTDQNGKTVPKGSCEDVTPGSYISKTLDDQLFSGQRQLELADEIDEIIGALVGQLAKQALTGLRGVRGLSESSYGSPSYLSQTTNQTSNSASQGYARAIANDIDQVESAAQAMHQILTANNTHFVAARQVMQALQQCYTQKGNATLASNTANALQAQVLAPMQVNDQKLAYYSNMLNNLDTIKEGLKDANSANIDIIQARYTDYIYSIEVPTADDVIIAQADANITRGQLDSLASSAQTQLTQCQAF